MTNDFPLVWKRAEGVFTLGAKTSIHGIEHWRRVEANGKRLALAEGANLQIAQLFAAIHDCQRHNENYDPQHGQRAATVARQWHSEGVFELDETRLEILCEALQWHEHGRISSDVNIGVCWDADRLDLPRVGVRPDPRLLSTATAKAIARGTVLYRAW
jgi:uncharacterized protein